MKSIVANKLFIVINLFFLEKKEKDDIFLFI